MNPTPINGHGDRRGGRTLPHNDDAEASILGGIILRNDVLDLIPELEPDDFFDPRHAIVFRAIRNLQAAKRPIDVVTIETEIEVFDRTYETHKLEAIGGPAFLGDLAQRVPTPDNVVDYTNTVRLLRRHRLAMDALSTALERARAWKHDPSELISEVAGELQRLELGGVQTTQRVKWTTPLSEYLGDTEPDDDDSTDWVVRDLVPRGEPWVWGGPMKGGKTWALIDLAVSMALGIDWMKFENTLGRPARVVLVCREDNRRRLSKRLWELTRSRGTSPRDPVLVEHLRITREPLRLPDPTDQRRLVDELRAFDADVVGVDNLTRVMVGDPNTTREAKWFTDAWSEIGEKTGASVGMLHHTRKPPPDGKSVDVFEMLRGSGDFGAAARNMIVAMPLRSEDKERISEVRMRGNLDLKRDGFVLGFERRILNGRWQSWFVDRGDIETAREDRKTNAKEAKAEQKKAEVAREFETRLQIAVSLARRNSGRITGLQFANALGLSSPRGKPAEILNEAVARGLFTPAGKLGYELVGADRQEGLL